MVRAWSLILGIGLVFLGLGGLGTTNAAGTGSWLVWLDFVAAFLSFVVAGTAQPSSTSSGRMAGTGMISIGLFVLWIAGLIVGNVPTSLVWWNFAFAVAYGLVSISSREAGKPTSARFPDEIDREQQRPPRRAA